MNQQDEYQQLTQMADAAFQSVALKVVQRARETGTPIVIWRDGRVVQIPVDEWEAAERQRKLDST